MHHTALNCLRGAGSHLSMYTSGMFFKTFLTLLRVQPNILESSSKVMPSGGSRKAARALLVTVTLIRQVRCLTLMR